MIKLQLGKKGQFIIEVIQLNKPSYFPDIFSRQRYLLVFIALIPHLNVCKTF